MKQLYNSVGLSRLCGLFGKTRQAFYDHNWRDCDGQLQEELIIGMVKAIRSSLPKVGGVKLHLMLKNNMLAHHIYIGRDGFFALLRKHNLLVSRKKRYVRTTYSGHHYKKWPDLLKHTTINAPEQVWVSDITYLKTTDGFIYLSLITDAYSRKIVGYHLSQRLKVQACLIALNKAIQSASSLKSLMHHSDRGIQYCCEPYVALLQSHGIKISMTQSGSPYDNAIAERVNGILKTEFSLDDTFSSYNAAVPAVHNAIDAYNRLRPHMSCGNMTPQQTHKLGLNNLKPKLL